VNNAHEVIATLKRLAREHSELAWQTRVNLDLDFETAKAMSRHDEGISAGLNLAIGVIQHTEGIEA
jgi:hypothetical protein